jgi:enoyl-CoA hydratase/carnithine racemase
MNTNPVSAANEPWVKRLPTGAILTLSLNRGERFNPLSLSMIAALEAELEAVAKDESVRVLVLRGEGRGFCAGHDLREMRAFAGDSAWQQRLFASCNRMMMKLTQLPQPVIAQVHGIATAAGCQLVSMCDIAIAAESTKFALPGASLGVFCSTPAVGVVRNIGRKRCMELLLTGDEIDAAEALNWGLINRVVPAERLEFEVRHFAELILRRSSAAIAIGKRTFYQQLERGLADAYEIAGDTMVRNLTHEDAAEGMDAFLQKRQPKWRSS